MPHLEVPTVEPVTSVPTANVGGPGDDEAVASVENSEVQRGYVWTTQIPGADRMRFQWGPAIAQSAALLGLFHAFRLASQEDTRAELSGPYFQDWVDSVKGLKGWDDGDIFWANYVGHPLEGAVTAYFQIQNDPRGRMQEFGGSRGYWISRLKAFGWAAAYSTIYELSPVGDAAIGNVGHPEKSPGTKGWVDLIITPTVGIGLVLFEDFIDMKVVWPIERRTHSKMTVRLLRTFAGLTRSFANLFRFKKPWHIDSRGPVGTRVRYSQFPPPY